MTAELTGSYLYTDLHARWQMLQQDRGSHSTETRAWSPFSKAVQKAKFSFLNNVDLGVALRLREEGRLASVRRVMRDAWKEELAADEYDEVNAVKLAENLQAAITEAEVEWEKVNSSLTKLSGAQVLAVGAAAGPLIAQGHAQWVAGLTLAAAGTSLAAGLFEKRGFHKRYPASFFMDLSDTD
jgi:hypothetical protein